jgi:hypothetical protein
LSFVLLSGVPSVDRAPTPTLAADTDVAAQSINQLNVFAGGFRGLEHLGHAAHAAEDQAHAPLRRVGPPRRVPDAALLSSSSSSSSGSWCRPPVLVVVVVVLLAVRHLVVDVVCVIGIRARRFDAMGSSDDAPNLSDER